NRVARMERSAIRDWSLYGESGRGFRFAPSGLRSLLLIPEQSAKQSARSLLRRGWWWWWWRSLLRLRLELRLRRRSRRARRGLLRLRRTLLPRRRRGRLRWIGLRADDGLVGAFAVGQPHVVDRMLEAMQ